VIPGEVRERHLLNLVVGLLHSRVVSIGVAGKEACEHGVHLASWLSVPQTDPFFPAQTVRRSARERNSAEEREPIRQPALFCGREGITGAAP